MGSGAWGLVIYYTIATWAPIVLLIHLPNLWWGITVKVVAALWLFGAVQHFIRNPVLISMIGSAGAGFVLNGVWFAALNFWPPYWARIALIFLILSTLWTCQAIVKKMMVNPQPEIEQIYRNGGPDLRDFRGTSKSEEEDRRGFKGDE